MTATSTLDQSVAVVMSAFGDLLTTAVGDATAVFRSIYGIADGNDYGRYFAGQNPLVPFLPGVTSVGAMLALGSAQRAAASTAIAAAITASTGTDEEFANAVFAAVEAVRQACGDPLDAVRLTSDLATFNLSVTPPGGDAIAAVIAGLAANADVLMRRASAVSLARATADYVPPSQQDAARVSAQAADTIDVVALEAADRYEDQSYQALDAMRVAVIEDLSARGGSLSPVVTRTFGAQQPALVLAYRLYQTADRVGDVLARNDAPHPSFMPVTVEALAS